MTDDDKYVLLMYKYKMNRGQDPQGSIKYLKAAMALRKKGKVSEDAVVGGAYL